MKLPPIIVTVTFRIQEVLKQRYMQSQALFDTVNQVACEQLLKELLTEIGTLMDGMAISGSSDAFLLKQKSKWYYAIFLH